MLVTNAEDLSRLFWKVDWGEVEKLKDLIKGCNRLFILGVGGSAANASHAVNDFRKICGIEAYAPTDNVAELTAVTNDYGWKYVFQEYLKVSKLTKDDMILVLSVGGGHTNASENLVYAIDYALKVGAKIGGIVGTNGGYTGVKADVCVKIPEDKMKTPYTEIFQVVITHLICEELKCK